MWLLNLLGRVAATCIVAIGVTFTVLLLGNKRGDIIAAARGRAHHNCLPR